MLTAKFINVSEWRSALIAIGDIGDDAMFICNDEGITFRGMDPSHVALLEIHFPKSSFLEFDHQTSFFGVNVVNFRNVMTIAGDGDLVELSIKGNDVMKIKVDGSLKMEFNLKLIERSEVSIPMPKIDVKSKISISPSMLAKILGNIEKISGHFMINSLENGIEFSGKGDIGDARINLEKGSPDLTLHDIIEESISSYDIEYMTKIIRSIGRTCNTVNMEYGNQTPVKMLFEMPSMVKVEYYLAPRVEY